MSKTRISRKTAVIAAAMMLVSIACALGTFAIALAIAGTYFSQTGVDTLPPAVAWFITFVMAVLSLVAGKVAHEYHGDYHEALDQLAYARFTAGRGQ